MVTEGTAVGTLPTPTRTGYTFAGWWTDASGGTQITAATTVAGNMTYYAHWTANAGGAETGGGGSRPWTGRRRSLKAAAFNVPADAPISANLGVKGLGTLALVIGDDGFEGTVGGYIVASAKVGGNWTRADSGVYTVATSGSLPPGTIEDLLPDGEPVRVKGGKWVFDKAASVKYAKGALSGLDDSKKPNLSAMKLTYTPKTGLFKGSFKLYALQGGKLKKFTVKITGVVVDGEGTGVAKLAKPAVTWSVSVQ